MRAEYVWQESYQAAIVETDDNKLQQRLQAAKAAIDDRLLELQMDHGGTPEERQAIADALGGLDVLRRELQLRSRETGPSSASMPPSRSASSGFDTTD